MHRSIGSAALDAMLSCDGKRESVKQPVRIGDRAARDQRNGAAQSGDELRQQRRHVSIDVDPIRRRSEIEQRAVDVEEQCAMRIERRRPTEPWRTPRFRRGRRCRAISHGRPHCRSRGIGLAAA